MYGPRFAYRKSRAVTASPTPWSQPSTEVRAFTEFLSRILILAWHSVVRSMCGLMTGLRFRVVQADYLWTRFLNLHQDNFRVSAGLVFRFAHW